jgi:hypothetical protein
VRPSPVEVARVDQRVPRGLKQDPLDTVPTTPDLNGAFARGCRRGASERATRRGLSVRRVDGATLSSPLPSARVTTPFGPASSAARR